MPADVFISYPHQNQQTADAACATLEASGIRCWIAPRDITPGVEWAAGIVNAIDHCRVMVLIFSSSANLSTQVHREVQRAFDNRIRVVPFRIENIDPSNSLAYYIKSVHWLDALTSPLEHHLEKLTETVAGFLRGDEKELTRATPPPRPTSASSWRGKSGKLVRTIDIRGVLRSPSLWAFLLPSDGTKIVSFVSGYYGGQTELGSLQKCGNGSTSGDRFKSATPPTGTLFVRGTATILFNGLQSRRITSGLLLGTASLCLCGIS